MIDFKLTKKKVMEIIYEEKHSLEVWVHRGDSSCKNRAPVIWFISSH